MSKVTIYHNPACGTSRNTLAMIRASGVEPEVIEYLKNPPGRERLLELIAAMSVSARDILREKGTPYLELGLDDLRLSEEALIHFAIAFRSFLVHKKLPKPCQKEPWKSFVLCVLGFRPTYFFQPIE